MRKLLILLLDAMILLALLWLFIFRSLIESFWVFLVATGGLFLAVVLWSIISTTRASRVESVREKQRLRLTTKAAEFEQEQREEQLSKQEARQRVLAAEHEARRPVCAHCGKTTDAVFRHRRIDGGPDRRFDDNPLLCGKCFQPYTPIRPWNLRTDGSTLSAADNTKCSQ